MTKPTPDQVAAAFVRNWENEWNSQGAAAAAKLYTPDSVLVGAVIAIGRPEIERMLSMLSKAGWTTISIKIVNARATGGVVLAACEFTAHGTGPNAGKTLNGRSSHVLTQSGDTWLSAMHSAA